MVTLICRRSTSAGAVTVPVNASAATAGWTPITEARALPLETRSTAMKRSCEAA